MRVTDELGGAEGELRVTGELGGAEVMTSDEEAIGTDGIDEIVLEGTLLGALGVLEGTLIGREDGVDT